ncbi:MAG: enoyl-CoA hydratase, partial [Myxococcota bacterium]
IEAHRVDSAGIFHMGKSPDGYEGVKSFLEKRPAAFPMKVSNDMPPWFPWWKERKFEGIP